MMEKLFFEEDGDLLVLDDPVEELKILDDEEEEDAPSFCLAKAKTKSASSLVTIDIPEPGYELNLEKKSVASKVALRFDGGPRSEILEYTFSLAEIVGMYRPGEKTGLAIVSAAGRKFQDMQVLKNRAEKWLEDKLILGGKAAMAGIIEQAVREDTLEGKEFGGLLRKIAKYNAAWRVALSSKIDIRDYIAN